MPNLIDEQLRERLPVPADGTVDVTAALGIARELAGRRPGAGHTLEYLQALATLGVVDAALARIVEPHLDALAILDQAGLGDTIAAIGADNHSTWGVYAAHSADHHLQAGQCADGWRLSGTKPWCSLADRLSHAIITAELPGRGQQAFAVRLDDRHVRVLPTAWVSRGLSCVPSGPIAVHSLPAVPVGDPGWYVARPGFGWGGIGVAAVWYGIALAFRERLLTHAGSRCAEPILLAQLGTIDEHQFAAQVTLEHAAAAIDAGCQDPLLLAQRVRAVVARAAEITMHTTNSALGPGPLVADEDYARRVADLGVYLRQHHGMRDLAFLGQLVAAVPGCSHV